MSHTKIGDLEWHNDRHSIGCYFVLFYQFSGFGGQLNQSG